MNGTGHRDAVGQRLHMAALVPHVARRIHQLKRNIDGDCAYLPPARRTNGEADHDRNSGRWNRATERPQQRDERERTNARRVSLWTFALASLSLDAAEQADCETYYQGDSLLKHCQCTEIAPAGQYGSGRPSPDQEEMRPQACSSSRRGDQPSDAVWPHAQHRRAQCHPSRNERPNFAARDVVLIEQD
jgi:hypothetical protein